ncbi:MAG: bifunctional adenosylcobinamide kinase/adenosylcobinamide-phosphate guanylyltransferase [Butyricicoccus sp.]|nr:bifunctional adenosylcobinamide kinase/adenosylcobinamide-phosphate guanylyltransferase [Butyricicoccus sp.]
MTVLIVGGRGQGKCRLAVRLFDLHEGDILDGTVCSPEEISGAKAVNGLHLLTRRMLQERRAPSALLPQLRGKIVICDELGCGVVPVERELEDWREFTGRLCCDLAAEADIVIRVIAGLPQVIKGTLPK